MAYRTRQEIFDLAWKGLKAQGFVQSVDDADDPLSCAYRGPSGRRCAIGFAIPDSDYSPALEGSGADEFGVMYAARIDPQHSGFARALQRCHDRNPSPASMEERLREFAAANFLSIPD